MQFKTVLHQARSQALGWWRRCFGVSFWKLYLLLRFILDNFNNISVEADFLCFSH